MLPLLLVTQLLTGSNENPGCFCKELKEEEELELDAEDLLLLCDDLGCVESPSESCLRAFLFTGSPLSL